MVLRFGLWISHYCPLLVVVSLVSPASLLAGADSRIRARSDPIVNLAVFALLYPLFQLTSTVSIPQPLDPSLPSTSSTAAAFLSTTSAATPAAGASRLRPQKAGPKTVAVAVHRSCPNACVSSSSPIWVSRVSKPRSGEEEVAASGVPDRAKRTRQGTDTAEA